MKRIYEGPFLTLDVDEEGRWAWIARTARSTREVTDVGSTMEGFAEAVATLPAARMRAVVDVRQAPGRNDEAFERTVVPAFQGVVGRFGKVAFLVATQIGKMHVQRLETKFGHVDVLTDEAEAQRFARGEP